MSNSTPTSRRDSEGTVRWYANGRLHRIDGPAVAHADGGKEWWVRGKKHRIDGPAVKLSDGTKKWLLKDEYHRIDGPAIEYADGSKVWCVNGRQHRIDGPAFEGADGSKAWWVKGANIPSPYKHVLTAVFARGLPIPKEVLLELVEAQHTAQSDSERIAHLKAILEEHWPMHMKKILATLFSDSDPAIKHLAFSLLGHVARPKLASGSAPPSPNQG